ncbi:MAG: AAA family ATPase [Deltaproteobacteria bacterium]|nr:AAA family ATPase [Deltaproteobacteria bacterium]
MKKRYDKKSPLKDLSTGLPDIINEKPDKTVNLPSQKDLENEISDYLSKKYGGRIRVVSQMVFPWQAKPDSTDQKKGTDSEKGPKLSFNLKPEELEAYLNRYVVRQDMAKAILATKICTHFNKITYLQEKGKDPHSIGNIKNNIILIGPTGVGKTYFIKLIAAKLGLPFVKGDATKFSETGYVGGDIEDLVRDLVQEADGDLERAQYGIVYIDEIDKIASSHHISGPDVSRAGVQRALLKPLEETEVDIRVPHDPISQIEAIERYRKTGKREKQSLNTRSILFIVSGAFGGLSDIIKNRLRKKGIGFGAEIDTQDEMEWLRHVKPQDLVEYGFESEFVGRLPVIAILEELSEQDLFEILCNSNNPVIKSKKQDFRAYGIDLKFEEDALRIFAYQAYQECTGARALVSVVERALLPFEKKLPSISMSFLVVTSDMVNDPEGELQKLLKDLKDKARLKRYQAMLAEEKQILISRLEEEELPRWESSKLKLTPKRLDLVAHLSLKEDLDFREASERVQLWIEQIKSYEDSFFNRCGLRINLEEDAVDMLLYSCLDDSSNLYVQCERLCNILEYGLTLIREKTAQDVFNISAEAVDNPELYINRLIRTCY